ncbi:MAG: hypothetical protein ACRC3B_13810 [Bacteroidia bacterium]
MKNGKKKTELIQEPEYIDSRNISAEQHERTVALIAAHKAKAKRKRAA